MTTIKAKELFGDDDANGPKAPISQSPANGLGAKNRAVGYGEDLTSAIANRTTYALALNDDDLDFRLQVIEEGGLDGVYRLGSLAVAGGGRRIHVDGGAVESWSTLSEPYAVDRANAIYRASSLEDTIDGSIALDVVSNAGLGFVPGAASFGLLDRRALVLSSAQTVFAALQEGLLNENNAGPDTLTLLDPGRWSQGAGGPTDILTGVDMVELDGPHAGLYVIQEIVDETRARLTSLSGEAAVFGTDTEAHARLFRPVVSVGGRSGSSRLSHGLRVVGLPGDEDAPGGIARGALELVPGGRHGTNSVVPEEGLRYALRTEVRGVVPGTVGYSGSITAAGGFEAQALDAMMGADRLAAMNFGWPGYRFDALPNSSNAPIGYFAYNQRPAGNFYGQLITNQDTFSREGLVSGIDRINFSPQVVYPPLYYTMGHPGALVEVTINNEPAGIFRIHRVAFGGTLKTDPLVVWLRQLDGSIPFLEPTNAVASIRFYSGVMAGRVKTYSNSRTVSTGTPHIASLEVSAPGEVAQGETPVALSLATHAHKHGYLIRAVSGNEGEVFSVDGDGVHAAKIKAAQLNVETLNVGSIILSPTRPLEDIPIPLALYSFDRVQQPIPSEDPSLRGWFLTEGNLPGQHVPEDPMVLSWGLRQPMPFFGGVAKAFLTIPLSGALPGATRITKLKLKFRSIQRPDESNPTTSAMIWRLVLQPYGDMVPITVASVELTTDTVDVDEPHPIQESIIDVEALGWYDTNVYGGALFVQVYNQVAYQFGYIPWGGHHVYGLYVSGETYEISPL